MTAQKLPRARGFHSLIKKKEEKKPQTNQPCLPQVPKPTFFHYATALEV